MQILIEILVDEKGSKIDPIGYDTLLVVKSNKDTES